MPKGIQHDLINKYLSLPSLKLPQYLLKLMKKIYFFILICIIPKVWAKPMEVFNAKQFMESVGSNQQVKIMSPLINLHDFALEKYNDLKPYESQFFTIHYSSCVKSQGKVEEVEFNIEIHDVENMVISSGLKDSCWLVTSASNSNVLNFERCKKIQLCGITFGHYLLPAACTGNVLEINNSTGVTIKQCKLFGSGMVGLVAHHADDLTLEHTTIYECTESIMSIGWCNRAVFKHCIFKDTPGGIFVYYSIENTDCITARFSNCRFENLQTPNMVHCECSNYNGSCLYLNNCIFPQNTIEQALGERWKENMAIKNSLFFGKKYSNPAQPPTKSPY
jgi:hypothetical protein